MIDCIFLIKFVQTKNIMGFYNIPKDTLDTFTEMLNNEQLGAVMRYSLTGAPEGDITDKLVLFAVTLLRKNLKTSEKEEEKEIKSKSKSEINRENAKKRWHANDATACEYANDANRISHKTQKEEQEKEKDNEEEEKESNIKNKEEEVTDKKNKEQEDAHSENEKNSHKFASEIECETKNDEKIVSPVTTNTVSPKIVPTEEEKEKTSAQKETLEEIGKEWNKSVTDNHSIFPLIVGMGVRRNAQVNARINEHGLDAVKKVIEFATKSVFLNGGSFSCGFDWCMRPTNFLKILEGNYNKQNQNQNAANKNAYGEVRESASERLDRLFHVGKYAQDRGGEDDVIDVQGQPCD